MTVVIPLIIVVPLLVWAAVEVFRKGLVYVDAGSAALLLVRGKTTERVLQPGPHWIWPFRQQGLEIYTLRELTYLAGDDDADPDDFSDPAVHTQLGDHAPALVSYALRFRLRADSLQDIHNRVGPQGIGHLVRDISRKAVLDLVDTEAYDITHTVGAGLDRLEADLTALMTERLGDAGIDLTMLTVLDVDLGELGELFDRVVRAKVEHDAEDAEAEVRAQRAAHDVALGEQLGYDRDELHRYLRLQLWRDAVAKWDGRLTVADAAIAGITASEDGEEK